MTFDMCGAKKKFSGVSSAQSIKSQAYRLTRSCSNIYKKFSQPKSIGNYISLKKKSNIFTDSGIGTTSRDKAVDLQYPVFLNNLILKLVNTQ
nr:hypothetical protein C05B10.2 - Caenorhabditis elegans [Caenorhabditis elegans]